MYKIHCYGVRRLEVGGVSGDSARSWLMEGRLLSMLLCWWDNSSLRRVAAKVWLAAWLRRVDHLETKAVGMAGCSMAGACRALDLAKSRMKLTASWFHLPSASMASTAPAGRQKFGICSFFAPSCCVEGCPPVGACGCPSRVKGDNLRPRVGDES